MEPVPPALSVQSLSHWTTREAPHFLSYSELIPFFLKFYSSVSLVVLGLRCCSRVSAVAASGGCPLVAVCGPLTVVASPVAEHWLPVRRLQCLQHAGSAAVAHGL